MAQRIYSYCKAELPIQQFLTILQWTIYTHLILLLLSINGVLVVDDDDDDTSEDVKPLLGVVAEDVDLLETVRDVVLLFVVIVVDDVANDVRDTVIAVVTAVAMVLLLFELTLCDLTVGLRGD